MDKGLTVGKNGRESTYQFPNMTKNVASQHGSAKILTEFLSELGRESKKCGLQTSQIRWHKGIPGNHAMAKAGTQNPSHDENDGEYSLPNKEG